MTEQEYRERLRTFRESCRVYRREKQILDKAYTTDPVLYGFIREDIEQVEYILELARKLFGTSAALMIYLLMIEEKTQTAVAYQMGITRRQLQYSFSKYMHTIFEEERNRATG